MSSKQGRFRIAVLDDYQDIALSLADWSALDARATLSAFNGHLADCIGYVSRGLYTRFYQDTVTNICRWLDSQAAEAVGV